MRAKKKFEGQNRGHTSTWHGVWRAATQHTRVAIYAGFGGY